MDLEIDVFAQQPYGKLALKKLAPVPDNFRLYQVEWQGDKHDRYQVMKITGAEFRLAKAGRNAGKLSIPVKGSDRTVFVTKQEIRTEHDSN